MFLKTQHIVLRTGINRLSVLRFILIWLSVGLCYMFAIAVVTKCIKFLECSCFLLPTWLKTLLSTLPQREFVSSRSFAYNPLESCLCGGKAQYFSGASFVDHVLHKFLPVSFSSLPTPLPSFSVSNIFRQNSESC